jgi:hypothetical protein
MSFKLTPEICINKASSNSRLTAAGRWATASDSHSQNCLQTFSFSLSLMRQPVNYACMLKNLLKLYCILTWDTLWCLFLVNVCLVWFGFFPFWWDNDRTTSQTPSPVLEAEDLTSKLLRLKHYCIWTWRFFYFFIFYFYYYFYFLFYFVSQSTLYLSNACSAYCWLVHYISLFIPLKHFCLFFVLGFFVCSLVFPLFL